MEPLAERLSVAGIGYQVGRQVAYSSDLVSLLCLGGERRGEGTGQRGQQETAAVHAGMVGRMSQKVNHVTRGS
jgi:hypothetical protein